MLRAAFNITCTHTHTHTHTHTYTHTRLPCCTQVFDKFAEGGLQQARVIGEQCYGFVTFKVGGLSPATRQCKHLRMGTVQGLAPLNSHANVPILAFVPHSAVSSCGSTTFGACSSVAVLIMC